MEKMRAAVKPNRRKVPAGARLALALASCCLALAAASAPAASAAEAAPLATDGLGDPFFPKAGNPGYDVSDYDLALDYQPSTNRLQATDTITATATEGLVEYSLDLYRLRVTAVTVDGMPVAFRRVGAKVNITPPA